MSCFAEIELVIIAHSILSIAPKNWNSVGNKIVNAALSHNPSFDIYFGLDGWMLSTISAGMSPVTSLFDALCQISTMGLLRLISLFYLMDFGRITQNLHDTKLNKAKDRKKD